MAKYQDSDIDIIVDNIKFLSERLDKLDSSGAAADLARERELLSRELNLSRSEREASINESSALSSKLSKAREDWATAAEETFARMRNNKASTTTWLQMLQEKQSGIEAQIAEINEREANLEQRRADLDTRIAQTEERFQYMLSILDERGLADAAAQGAAGRVDEQVNQIIRAEVERQVRIALQKGPEDQQAA